MNGRALIAGACFFAMISAGQANTPPAHPHYQEPEAASPPPPAAPVPDLRGTHASPFVITGAVETTLPPPPTSEQIDEEKRKTSDDHRASWSTVWLAVLTAALAVIASLQLWLFLRQLKLSEKAARDAEMAAKAAKASADILPKIERAYVFAQVVIDQLGSSTNIFRYDYQITARFTNHGKTPAVLTRVRAYPTSSDAPPEQLLETSRAERKVPDGLVIGAGDFFDIEITDQLSDEEWRDLVDGSQQIYAVGVVDYKDVMDQDHHTSFCWQIRQERGDLKATIYPSPLNNRG